MKLTDFLSDFILKHFLSTFCRMKFSKKKRMKFLIRFSPNVDRYPSNSMANIELTGLLCTFSQRNRLVTGRR